MSCVRDSLPNQIISYWQHLTLGVFTLYVGKSQKYGRNGAPPPLLLSINFLFKSCFQYICIQIIKFTKHAERLVWHHKLPGRFTEMKVKKKPTKNPTCVDVKPPSRGFDQHQLPYVRERLLCFCYIQRLFTFTAAEEVHTSSLKTVEIIRVFFFSSFLTTDFLPCLPDLSQSDADAVVLINLTNTEVTCFTSCLLAVICQEWVTPSHTGSRPSAPVVTVISVWWTLWRHQAKGKLSSRQDNWRWSLRN